MVRRVYGSHKTNSCYGFWLDLVRGHKAVLLQNGQNPEDFPTQRVAYETPNFGWIFGPAGSHASGGRKLILKY